MSMISSLIDELNKSADEWTGSNMFELARMCREAADTIWQLRDDLQRTNAENAKLRELVRELLPCYLWSDCYDKTCQVADTPRCPRPSRLLERARELGVEVSG